MATDEPYRGFTSTFHKSKRKLTDKGPKGDPNKHLPQNRSSKRKDKINLRAVGEVLAARGLDPTDRLVDIIESGSLEPDVESRTLLTLLEYVQPKRKSVEVSGTVGIVRPEQLSDADLLKIAMQAAAEDATDVEFVDAPGHGEIIEALPAPQPDEPAAEIDPLS